ncbi:lariat debranching enzyme, C-terminal domain-containing protein [Whalleya microplaca]|nr:lariat debranching enzyme, C-terminal domain-containing protein [Whalleya microplaca]
MAAASLANTMYEKDGVRIAVEGCGHGTLDAIYAAVAKSCEARKWDGVDLLIIGGDFQAARNAADLYLMAVPRKYRQLGDFQAYYRGDRTAPYLTIFIGGNHEAAAHLSELYYGGWVAPNIYYLGAANVLRFGPLRIAGMSGIWKGGDYRRTHHERLPFKNSDIRSFYHVREIDVRKLLLLREQVDVGLSHDWPRGIENHGNYNALWKIKPDFERESRDGTLGNPAAAYVMDRLRPAYWFSAHLHCKYAAIKTYDPPSAAEVSTDEATTQPSAPVPAEEPAANPDEIDLDMDEEDDEPAPSNPSNEANPPPSTSTSTSAVPDELRAQLPASFAKPTPASHQGPKLNPGQPVPPTITNTTTRFLSLDKCLPGRKFIQVCALAPVDRKQFKAYPPSRPRSPSKSPRSSGKSRSSSKSRSPPDKPPTRWQRYHLHYDPEWLAITRVFAPSLQIGDPDAAPPPDLGEAAYAPLIAAERAWVEEHVVRAGKLRVPENWAATAPPHRRGAPEIVNDMPDEYSHPQVAAFCEMLGVPNLWHASPEERKERRARARAPVEDGGQGGEGGGGGGGEGEGARGVEEGADGIR